MKLSLLLSLLILSAANGYSQKSFSKESYQKVCIKHSYPNLSDNVASKLINSDSVYTILQNRTRTVSTSSYKDVTMTAPGTLAQALGSDADIIDSLVVRGPINDSDFNTIWSATFHGNLAVVNLEHAVIENGKIPKDAFWHQGEQLSEDWTVIKTIRLRKIILPEGLTEIGDGAFSYAINLESVNIPSSLRKLGIYSFSNCIALKTSPLILPEGLEKIPAACFLNCESLGEVSLPSTVRHIGEIAFYGAKINKINFKEGLQTMETAAFYATNLEEVVLPESCLEFIGSTHFALNHKLKKLHLPSRLTTIPVGFADNDIMLEEVNIPSTVKYIMDESFIGCNSLKHLELPEGLNAITTDALKGMGSLEQITFPATLQYMGKECCMNWASIKEIRCAAKFPPAYFENTMINGTTPDSNGPNGNNLFYGAPENTPVYVPVGSADVYRTAPGWSYFTNYIEMDMTGIEDITCGKEPRQDVIYDLTGRRVLHPAQNHLYIRNGKKFIYNTH